MHPTLKHVKHVAAVAATIAAGLGVTALAGAHSAPSATHHVRPGQSIQAAIDHARSGDTIVVAPGVYRENLTVTKDRLTLRGSGDSPSGTVLEPAAKATPSVCNEFGEVSGMRHRSLQERHQHPRQAD